MRMISVDPGLVTGLVSFAVDDDKVNCLESYQVDHIGLGHYFSAIKWTSETIVVVEKFTITSGTAKKSQAPWSLESTGICRYFTESAGFEMFQHMPSAHMNLVSNQVLKNAGLFVPGEHARDAARVGLFHLITKEKVLKWTLKTEEED